MTSKNTRPSMPYVPQRVEGYKKFCSSEALGAPFGNNIRFKALMYNIARRGYDDGWMTGLTQGWASANSEHQFRVTERDRSSFVIGKIDDAHYAVRYTNAPLVMSFTPSKSWMKPIIESIVPDHMKVLYAGFYMRSPFAVQSDMYRATRFYESLLTKSWRHGWTDGENEAQAQYRIRISNPSYCPMARLEHRLQQEEVRIVQRLANEMFAYQMPLEGWNPEDDSDETDDDEYYRRRRSSPSC